MLSHVWWSPLCVFTLPENRVEKSCLWNDTWSPQSTQRASHMFYQESVWCHFFSSLHSCNSNISINGYYNDLWISKKIPAEKICTCWLTSTLVWARTSMPWDHGFQPWKNTGRRYWSYSVSKTYVQKTHTYLPSHKTKSHGWTVGQDADTSWISSSPG